MNRVTLYLVTAIVLALSVATTASACGWYQTCETEEWLKGTLAGLLP